LRGVNEARRAALVLSREIPGTGEAALLAPVESCNILSDSVPGGEIRNARARIRQLRNMDLLARDVVGAVAELQRVIATARARVALSLLVAARGRQWRRCRRSL